MKSTPTARKLKSYIRSFRPGKKFEFEEISWENILQDKLLISKAVRKGVPWGLFVEIRNNSPFNTQEWSRFLNINLRTLQRYRQSGDHVFKPLQSEKIFELAEVASLGNKVFDSTEDFTTWLHSPSVAMGGEKPIDLMDNSYGQHLVLDELYRIEYGVFA